MLLKRYYVPGFISFCPDVQKINADIEHNYVYHLISRASKFTDFQEK